MELAAKRYKSYFAGNRFRFWKAVLNLVLSFMVLYFIFSAFADLTYAILAIGGVSVGPSIFPFCFALFSASLVPIFNYR